MSNTLTMGLGEATLGLQGGDHPSLDCRILADKAPLAFRGGDTNLYRYVHNDPLNRVDPSGLDDEHILQPAWNPIFHQPPAQEASDDISKNYNKYKDQISGQIQGMFPGLATDPSRVQIEQEADAFAKEYIEVVRRYLRSHPSVVPESTRNGLGDLLGLDKRTNCETWMSYILENMNGKYNYIRMNRGHYQGLIYQHNFVVVRPTGYIPKVYPTLDPNIRILDPWPTLRPFIGPPEYNRFRQVPTTIPGVVDKPN